MSRFSRESIAHQINFSAGQLKVGRSQRHRFPQCASISARSLFILFPRPNDFLVFHLRRSSRKWWLRERGKQHAPTHARSSKNETSRPCWHRQRSPHQKTSHFPPKAPSNSCRDLLLNILGFYLDFLSLSRFLDKMPTFAGAGEMRRQNVGFISRDNSDIGMTFLAETLHSHNPEQNHFRPPDDKFRLTVAGGSEWGRAWIQCSIYFPFVFHQSVCRLRGFASADISQSNSKRLSKLSALPLLFIFAWGKSVKLAFKTSSWCIAANWRHLRLNIKRLLALPFAWQVCYSRQGNFEEKKHSQLLICIIFCVVGEESFLCNIRQKRARKPSLIRDDKNLSPASCLVWLMCL